MFGGSLVTLVVAFGLLQWRIQDFPEEGAPTLGGGGGATCNFAKCSKKETAWNWKNLDTGRGGGSVSLMPP